MLNFSANQPDKLDSLQQKKVYAILLDTIDSQTFLEIFFNKKETDIGIISTEDPFLPYLSLTENLFIASSIKEKDKKQALLTAFDLVHLDLAILTKDYAALSPIEKLKCQLLQLFFSKKATIVITDVFQDLTIAEKQELLPLIRQVARKGNKQLLVFTTDEKIANSPYIDQNILNKTA